MVNYQLAKVYKIVSNQTDQIYIGSTCRPLSERMAGHRGAYKAWLAGKGPKYTSFDVLQHGDAAIFLIEECPCDNNEQLLRRERFHIEALSNRVNRIVPTQTDAEYYRANVEKIRAMHVVYYEAHQEEIKAYKAGWYSANREVIAQRNSRPIECECGRTVTRSNLTRHQKSPGHLAALTASAPTQ